MQFKHMLTYQLRVCTCACKIANRYVAKLSAVLCFGNVYMYIILLLFLFILGPATVVLLQEKCKPSTEAVYCLVFRPQD